MREAEAPISRVTVLTDGARITRTARVLLPKGTHHLVVKGITGLALEDSFRVTGRGPAVLSSIDVKSESRVYSPEEERRKALLEQLRSLQKKRQEVADEIDVDNASVVQLDMMASEFAAIAAPLLASGESAAEDALGFYREITEAKTELQRRIRTNEQELGRLDEQIEAVKDNLTEIGADARTEPVYNVEIHIEMKSEGSLELDVTYHVSDAFWTPAYDVHLSDRTARITRLAMVTNHTREDWSKVPLVVSTASSRPVEIREPTPWFVDEAAQVELDVLARSIEAGAPPGVAGAPRVKESREIGGTVTYEVEKPVTIPTGRSRHPVRLAEEVLDSKTMYYWYADKMADVVAHDEVTNGQSVLLRGEAKVFQDGEYVGQSVIPLVAPGETFKVGTRRTYDVRAEKKLKKRVVEKAGITRGKKRRSYEYELRVENHSENEIEIEILDRIPHSEDPEIEVHIDVDRLGVEEFRLGILKWRRTILPGESITITYSFEVVWNKDITVVPPLP